MDSSGDSRGGPSLRRLASRALPPSSSHASVASGFVITLGDRELVVVDPALRILRSFRLPSDAWGSHAVSRDLAIAAISCDERIAVVDEAGRIRVAVDHDSWRASSGRGSTAVTWDGTWVLGTAPGDGGDLWLAVDLTSGTLTDVLPLACRAEGSVALSPQTGPSIALSVFEGQDGGRSYVASRRGARWCAQEILDPTRTLVALDADLDATASVPYGSTGPVRIAYGLLGSSRHRIRPEVEVDVHDEIEPLGMLLGDGTLVVALLFEDALLLVPPEGSAGSIPIDPDAGRVRAMGEGRILQATPEGQLTVSALTV